MRYSVLIMIAFAFLACRKDAETIVRLHVEGERPAVAPALITKDSTYHAEWRADNSVEFVLPKEAKHSYAIFFLGESNVFGFIEPGKDFEVSVKFEGGEAKPTFSGKGAEVCRFVNSGAARFTPDYKLEEAEFLASLEENVKKMHAEVDTRKFSRQFSTLERNRIFYNVYSSLTEYPSSHIFATWEESGAGQAYEPSENYYKKLTEVLVEDASLLDMQSYQKFIKRYVSIMIFKEFGEAKNGLQYLKTELEYINRHFKNPQVIEYLVHDATFRYVENNGVEHLAEFLPAYRAAVNDEAKRGAFDELCGKWLRIAKGQPSPSFKYTDIHGKEVALSDFAGKYVYIDIWATWCGPCRREIPSLQKLEKKYKGKKICFVSISCDQDRKAWEKVVKEDKMEGIQLHAGEDYDFLRTYMVATIPRFILLDREGKIIASHMSRPSDPETVKTLDALLGV